MGRARCAPPSVLGWSVDVLAAAPLATLCKLSFFSLSRKTDSRFLGLHGLFYEAGTPKSSEEDDDDVVTSLPLCRAL